MGDQAMRWWPAPAKINLFLRVLGRRPDGYHELQTLFQLLDWGDHVGISPTDGPEIHRQPVSYGVPPDEDLAIKAAKLLQQETGSRLGAEIGIRKRVPPGSGMGGGSSDAATVLLVLNRLWDCSLDIDELARLGRSLGADVPVFVRGHSALAQGVGEQLVPVRLGRRHFVLVFPDFPVSTREVFADPNLNRDSKPVGLKEGLNGGGINDCEAVVRRRFPEFNRMMLELEHWGAPRMTGTGSGIFIPMDDEESANSAARALKNLYNVRAVQGVDRSPLHAELEFD